MLEKYLQEIGLNDKEAAIYLALLQVDNSSVIDISKKTKINRSTIYFVLEGLGKKGLVSEVQVDKKVHYAAEPPERLETFVERQRVILEEQAKRLKDIIPEIKSIQRESGERPVVKYFEGRNGAISAYSEFYEINKTSNSKKGYFIYNRDLLQKVFTENERAKFVKIRTGKNVDPVSVYTNEDGNFNFGTPGMRARIDNEKYPILADITIIEDRIIASTLGGRVSSILIKSKDIAITIASLVQYINDVNKIKKGGE
ncbi:MAG: hypothetical protein A2648_00105 [Candidatus Lloydbacteria bacterium RIFCSPHIGHO2_01_FULL_41_20]|uniref:Transcription regulator TrmB N-terminal domain-containing protein n=1 Tax=Candidatus Lloydbacteria bacterium RIFCSPHIGHO2_01_FULL_41_20 TaxID=1798657 RepID=A0A1G2CTK7_9BACT|nr:MAG: hypothetical protein A2648_00105 [Candidatus Lloydbacteria bacterium RIFCSPHIGHO2_01_FULL_41_20]